MKLKVLCFFLMLFSVIKAQVHSYKDSLFTSYFRMTETGSMTAGDGGMSVLLPDGRTVWIISDSYISPVNIQDTSLACIFDINNCLVLQDKDNHSQLETYYNFEETGVARTFFTTNECPGGMDRFFPVHGFVNNQKLFVFLHRMQGQMDTILFAGNYLAQVSLPEITLDSIWFISTDGIAWGDYVLPFANGDSIYIYGSKKNWITFDYYLAKAAASDNYNQWNFYSHLGWTSHLSEAEKIPIETGNCFGNCASIIPLQGNYYLFLQENGFLQCDLGRKVYAFKAENPWGSFTNQTEVYEVDDYYKYSYMVTYQAFAHHQFMENNELLLSYAVNDICPTECNDPFADRRNADTYRLKFARIPFAVIDSGLISTNNLKKENNELTLYPNPFTNRLNIEFKLYDYQKVKLSVYNQLGKEISTIFNGKKAKGKHHIAWNSENMFPGFYTIQLKTQAKTIIKKAILVK